MISGDFSLGADSLRSARGRAELGSQIDSAIWSSLVANGHVKVVDRQLFLREGSYMNLI